MNIIELTMFIINIMTSPFLLPNYFVGRKDRCENTKHKTIALSLERLELLLDIPFSIDPSQH